MPLHQHLRTQSLSYRFASKTPCRHGNSTLIARILDSVTGNDEICLPHWLALSSRNALKPALHGSSRAMGHRAKASCLIASQRPSLATTTAPPRPPITSWTFQRMDGNILLSSTKVGSLDVVVTNNSPTPSQYSRSHQTSDHEQPLHGA